MRHPQVLIIYNEPVLPADHPDAASEHDIVDTSLEILTTLADAGYPTRRLGFSHDPSVLLDELRRSPPDAIFNLFEGLATNTVTEISVVSLLEWLGVPFTGSPSFAIALGRDKVRTKYLLQGAGLPTPAFMVVEGGRCPRWGHPWPAIVKPACQDSSVGIEQASVVTSQAQLESRVEYVLERYGPPVLVEQFIAGRELHANYIEDPGEAPGQTLLTPLPLAEVRFDYKPGYTYWPIYSYDAKWATDTEEFRATPLVPVRDLPAEWAERVVRLGGEAFRLAGLRDYGRIDIRLTSEGEPYILEVNPNPYLGSVALRSGLEDMGRSHSKMIVGIAWAALARGNKNREGTPKPARARRRKAPARRRSATGGG